MTRRARLRLLGDAGGHAGFPSLGRSGKSIFVQWPVVEDRGIEVRAVRPDNGPNLRVQRDAGEDKRVAEWAVKFPFKHIGKINDRLDPVLKAKTKRIGCDVLESGNPVDGMSHGYSRGLIGMAERPLLNCCQSASSSFWCSSAHASTSLC